MYLCSYQDLYMALTYDQILICKARLHIKFRYHIIIKRPLRPPYRIVAAFPPDLSIVIFPSARSSERKKNNIRYRF
jgi:hypothetical protein